jgi:K(+)-stimulated pyrophosphate-energized sodium pump
MRILKHIAKYRAVGLALLAGLALYLYAQPSLEQAEVVAATSHQTGFQYFEFLHSPKYSQWERLAMFGALAASLMGLAYAYVLMREISAADQGTEKMKAVADAVREGSNAYLAKQFKMIAALIGVLVFVLFFTKAGASSLGMSDPFAYGRAGAFLVGALFSATVAFVGMRMATIGNLRVAAAAQVGFGKSLMLGYRTGTITGMLNDGLGLLGGTVIFMAYGEHAYEALLGFGFGGTLLALFMRVGGGIYTKAADVGADLVGKIEKDIPEDDPRNAATIADNVGDNVGDCAGMAADVFESYEVTMVAAMILGYAAFGHQGVIFPLLVRAIGVISSMISTRLVRAGDKGNVAEAMRAINVGFVTGAVLSVGGFLALGYAYLSDMRPAWACLVGVLLCMALKKITEYYTSTEHPPVKGIVKNCTTGHATNIIEGFAVGYESSVWTALAICGAIMGSVLIFSDGGAIKIAYGVAMCGIGLLTLTGSMISMDVFGPVADNANGIGEMGYDKEQMGAEKYAEARQILADLDAVGNTTKAVTKGIAVGSAVIAAVSLFASFITVIGSGGQGEDQVLPASMFDKVAGMLSISDPRLLVGMLIGGAVPLLFSSMTIKAVGRAAFLIVNECREQFRDKEIWAGTKKPDYARVVGICTESAQQELVGPALLAVLSPVLVGFLLGPIALAGFLGGSIVVGQLLASFMCNAGGAWDNAKKMVEDEPRTAETGKGSDKHKASVTGDTVGDPLKDTAGPAVNPLLKVMNMVAILTVPIMMLYDAKVVSTVRQAAAEAGFTLPASFEARGIDAFFIGAVTLSLLGLAWAIKRSKREN